MPELVIHGADGEQKIVFEGTPLISELLAPVKNAPLLICGGNGKCGKCAVYASGALSAQPGADGKVLACRTRLLGDGEVWLPERKILTQIETHTAEEAAVSCPLEGRYGAAVDIGTTTVVLRLLDLTDGRTLATVGCENPQRSVAADVIGRIDSALHGGLALQESMIRDTVGALEKEALSQAGLTASEADVRVITGNTTMLYLFTGRSPEPLSHAPFEADCLFGTRAGKNVFPPCMGAFVGADITCAVLAAGMCEQPQTALLIDIGTNGEIALWHNGRLTCCATAAGPAFEGGGILCGTGSILGAIDSARVRDGRIAFTTIGGGPVTGICGSGLIDLTAALLDAEMMDETGVMEDDLVLGDQVRLVQKDIRQVQLAKAAIAAGIETLLRHEGLSYEDVSVLYIAGGFGSHLNLQSAARIGLIRDALVPKAKVIGNAALGGAVRLLVQKEQMRSAGSIARDAVCLNLGGDPAFSDAFVECMLFE